MTPAGYMTGPGASIVGNRANITAMTRVELMDLNYQQQALIPNGWATHGGDDVGAYANGPFSYLFHSTVDNTFVSQATKYAICVEPYHKEAHCSLVKPGGKGEKCESLFVFTLIMLLAATLYRP